MAYPELIYTFVAALAVAGVHILSGIVPETPQGKYTRSFAAGIALSYVFLHILPDLAKYETEVLRTIRNPVFPWFEEHMYATALTGLLVAYVMRSRPGQSATFGFRRDLTSSSLRNALTGYAFAQQKAVLWPLLLLAVAFGSHYWESDRSLLERYADRFCRRGPATLAAAIIGGWIIGIVIKLPVRPVAVLFSFLAGGIILSTLKDELPRTKTGNFIMLCLGTVIYSILLLTVLSGIR